MSSLLDGITKRLGWARRWPPVDRDRDRTESPGPVPCGQRRQAADALTWIIRPASPGPATMMERALLEAIAERFAAATVMDATFRASRGVS